MSDFFFLGSDISIVVFWSLELSRKILRGCFTRSVKTSLNTFEPSEFLKYAIQKLGYWVGNKLSWSPQNVILKYNSNKFISSSDVHGTGLRKKKKVDGN